jgi:Protein of unknown function (DUF3307)
MELFNQEEAIVIIKLLIAHILGDFAFQSSTWIDSKREKGIKSRVFYYHLVIVALLSFIAIGQFDWLAVEITLAITISHGLIDWWKIKVDKNASLNYFLIDQFLHVVVLMIAWLFIIQGWDKVQVVAFGLWNSFPILIVLLGFLFCIVPSCFIVKFVVKQLIVQNEASDVKRGGMLIGIFERKIIFTFVLFNQYEAIGFLVTGKSILRFSDGQKKETEYVLVGTMLSYTLAILTGVLVNLFRQV